MNTRNPDGPSRRSLAARRFRLAGFSAAALAGAALPAVAANILWVSDAPPAGFSGPGTSYTDQGFVTLLQSAGHNVTRFNGPDANATVLTPAELAAMNTNDLIIIGRAAGSGAWQDPQGNQWNVDITKPLICMSPYLIRNLASGNRMGWATGGTVPDDVPTQLSAVDPASPATDYLLGGVEMNGNLTADNYDELLDRNTSHILEGPYPGGRVLLRASFLQEDNNTARVCPAVFDLPAGTGARAGASILAGYRMFFAGGTRESAAAPNSIPLYTGRENLTPTGESIFLRAVALALNNGNPPAVDPDEPVAITRQPAGATVVQDRPAALSVAISGAAPRTIQWQKFDEDSQTFTNIPNAVTTFSASRLSFPKASGADAGRYRAVASNPNAEVISAEAVLTVDADVEPPVALSADSVDGKSILVCFNEPVDPTTSQSVVNYSLNDPNGTAVAFAVLRADQRSVALSLTGPLSPNYILNVANIEDLYENAIPESGTDLASRNLGLTGVNIGALNPGGTNVVCGPDNILVSGGGLDVTGPIDQLRFAHRSVTGDFDARVRVNGLLPSDRLESVAKALLMARTSTATNSAHISVYATPITPADNSVGTIIRTNTSGPSGSFGAAVNRGASAAAWLRLQRQGDVFTAFRSTDGIDWTTIGSSALPLPETVLVGLGAVSHRNGRLVTASFSGFQVAPRLPSIVNVTYHPGGLAGSFATQAGFRYVVEYTEDVANGPWIPLTSVDGTGALQSFTDESAAGRLRFYRVFIP